MSLLETKAKPVLAGKYEVGVKDFVEIENEKGGYVKVTLDVPEYGDYIYCIFPSQVNYVTSCLNQQLEVERDTYTLGEALKKIKKLNVWFSYNQDYNRMNVALHEPVVTDEEVDL